MAGTGSPCRMMTGTPVLWQIKFWKFHVCLDGRIKFTLFSQATAAIATGFHPDGRTAGTPLARFSSLIQEQNSHKEKDGREGESREHFHFWAIFEGFLSFTRNFWMIRIWWKCPDATALLYRLIPNPSSLLPDDGMSTNYAFTSPLPKAKPTGHFDWMAEFLAEFAVYGRVVSYKQDQSQQSTSIFFAAKVQKGEPFHANMHSIE